MAGIMEMVQWGDWRVIVALLVVGLVVLYFYLMSNMNYWTKQGFPQLNGSLIPIFGNTFKLIMNFTGMFEELYKEAGDRPFVGFFQGSRPALLVKDPELIKRILIKDFHAFMDRGFKIEEEIDPFKAKSLSNLSGERWKNTRAKLSPTFTSGRMKAMFPMMYSCSDVLLNCIENDVKKNSGEAVMEMKERLSSFNADVITTCCFGIQCDALQNPETCEYRRMGKLILQMTWKRRTFLRNLVQEIVKAREEAIDAGKGAGYGDFMHHLVLLKKKGVKVSEIKDEDDEGDNEFLKVHKEADLSWTNVDLDDLAAQAMLFFAAGFETTASLTSFVLFELSKSEENKEIQRKVQEELDSVMQENGGNFTYEGLKRMHILERVVKETLRLHSPAGVLVRMVVENYKIPETDLIIEKDTILFIPTQPMLHDEKFFLDSKTFNPDRFLNKDNYYHFAYLPFGDGPRLCIGSHMAGIMDMLQWGDWRVMVALLGVALVTLYFYLMSNMNYWAKRGFPQLPASPIPIFGNTFKLLTGQANFIEMFDEIYKKAGDQQFVGFFQGSRPVLLVKEPELIKRILIKDFHAFMDRGFKVEEDIDPLNAKGLSNLNGQRWKNMRARLSPTFTSGRMKAMFPMMYSCSDVLLNCIENDVKKNSGEAIMEMKECLACFSIDVIATCAFGIQCDALQNPETSEFRRMGKMAFEMTWKRRILFALLLCSPKLLKKLGLKFTNDESYVFFRNLVQEIVKAREEAIDAGKGAGYGDFMHHLVLLKKKGVKVSEIKDEDDEDDNEFLKVHKEADVSWANVDLDDLAAQAMLFFAAGFETTSSLSSFVLFELSKSEENKEIQRKLQEEVDSVMEEYGGKITYEGLKRMQLLERVVNETLRIHPPAGLLSRIAVENYKIPETDLIIEKDTMVFIPTQAMQNDEKFFPDPEKFNPDRFLNKDNYNHFTFLPFGDGPRLCIGERFALMQVRLGLAALLSKFEFDLCREKTPLPMEYSRKTFILYPKSGIWLKIKVRDGKK